MDSALCNRIEIYLYIFKFLIVWGLVKPDDNPNKTILMTINIMLWDSSRHNDKNNDSEEVKFGKLVQYIEEIMPVRVYAAKIRIKYWVDIPKSVKK